MRSILMTYLYLMLMIEREHTKQLVRAKMRWLFLIYLGQKDGHMTSGKTSLANRLEYQ